MAVRAEELPISRDVAVVAKGIVKRPIGRITSAVFPVVTEKPVLDVSHVADLVALPIKVEQVRRAINGMREHGILESPTPAQSKEIRSRAHRVRIHPDRDLVIGLKKAGKSVAEILAKAPHLNRETVERHISTARGYGWLPKPTKEDTRKAKQKGQNLRTPNSKAKRVAQAVKGGFITTAQIAEHTGLTEDEVLSARENAKHRNLLDRPTYAQAQEARSKALREGFARAKQMRDDFVEANTDFVKAICLSYCVSENAAEISEKVMARLSAIRPYEFRKIPVGERRDLLRKVFLEESQGFRRRVAGSNGKKNGIDTSLALEEKRAESRRRLQEMREKERPAKTIWSS